MAIDDVIHPDEMKVNIPEAHEIMGRCVSESTLRKIAIKYILGPPDPKVRYRTEKRFGVGELIDAIEKAIAGDGMNLLFSTVEGLMDGKPYLESYLKNRGQIGRSDLLDVDKMIESLPSPDKPWDPGDEESQYNLNAFLKVSHNIFDRRSGQMIFESGGDDLRNMGVRLSPGEILRRIEYRVSQEKFWSNDIIKDLVVPFLFLARKLPGKDMRAYAKKNPIKFENMVAEIKVRYANIGRSDEKIYSLDDILTYGEVCREIDRKINDVTLRRLTKYYCGMEPIDISVQSTTQKNVEGYILREFILAIGRAAVDGRRNISDDGRKRYYDAAMELIKSTRDAERLEKALNAAYSRFTAQRA